jgi:Mg2+/Co2+ transporter CorB
MILETIASTLAEHGLTILAILALIAVSGFFSGSETALTAASRARMHSLQTSGDARAGTVNTLIERKDRLIGALLIGNNLVNILASALATSVLLSIFGDSGVAVATLTMTLLLVIFAEVLPKSWAISTPDRFAMFVAPVVKAFVLVVGPLSSLINWMVRKIMSVFGVTFASETSMLSAHEEIRGAVDLLHREGSVVKADRDRLGGVLDLGELEVSDVMIHRTSMRMLNADETPESQCSRRARQPLYENADLAGVDRQHHRHRSCQGCAAGAGRCAKRNEPAGRGQDCPEAVVRARHDKRARSAQRIPAAQGPYRHRGGRVWRSGRAGDARGHP